ncbi:hypothetical protein FDU21_07405 [Xanthomonas oryzae pv. oryzae]|nr:hypothetical protein FDU21_07405 [Xanthomonas oryzae pv. oryzae]
MSNNFPEGLKLPNELERRQMFYQLKKESSFTAWNRMLELYQAWADVTERSVREADAKGWLEKSGISESDYVSILKGLAHQEEGVRRLRKGDKRVFKFDANGEFVMGHRTVSYWLELVWRIKIGENGINEALTPLWDEFRTRLDDVANLRSEIWGTSSKVVTSKIPRPTSMADGSKKMSPRCIFLRSFRTCPTLLRTRWLPQARVFPAQASGSRWMRRSRRNSACFPSRMCQAVSCRTSRQ